MVRRRRLRPGRRRRAASSSSALRGPAAALARKVGDRRDVAARTRVSTCPATRCCSERRVVQAEPRRLRAGGARPASCSPATRAASTRRRSARSPVARWLGAGWPDYPWIFATDAEYTAFAAVAAGQFEPIKAHLRALRDISDIVNARLRQGGARGHPGRPGVLRRQRATPATPTRPRSSRARWRWSGAGPATTPSATRCTTSPSQPAVRDRARRRRRRLARGPRQRGAARHGRGEARRGRLHDPRAARPRRPGGRDAATPRPRALGDRAGRAARAAVRGGLVVRRCPRVRRLADRSRQREGLPAALDRADADGGRAARRPAGARARHGTLAQRERDCYTGEFGLFHTGTGPTTRRRRTPGPVVRQRVLRVQSESGRRSRSTRR